MNGTAGRATALCVIASAREVLRQLSWRRRPTPRPGRNALIVVSRRVAFNLATRFCTLRGETFHRCTHAQPLKERKKEIF